MIFFRCRCIPPGAWVPDTFRTYHPHCVNTAKTISVQLALRRTCCAVLVLTPSAVPSNNSLLDCDASNRTLWQFIFVVVVVAYCEILWARTWLFNIVGKMFSISLSKMVRDWKVCFWMNDRWMYVCHHVCVWVVLRFIFFNHSNYQLNLFLSVLYFVATFPVCWCMYFIDIVW